MTRRTHVIPPTSRCGPGWWVAPRGQVRVGDVVLMPDGSRYVRHVVASMRPDHDGDLVALRHAPVDPDERPMGAAPLTWWRRLLDRLGW